MATAVHHCTLDRTLVYPKLEVAVLLILLKHCEQKRMFY